MQVLLSLIERHFLMHFYVPFYFFKVDFDFAPVPKAAFCKAFTPVAKAAFCKSRAHRGTPK